MFRRQIIGFAAIVLCGVGVWFFGLRGTRVSPPAGSPGAAVSASSGASLSSAAAAFPLLSTATNAPAPAPTFSAYRLSNTTTPYRELIRRDSAVLLENARLDTTQPLNLNLPAHLRAAEDSGSYIVQARGPVTEPFRARLQAAGVTLVSYIPNNAWLVRASEARVQWLTSQPEVQAALPYEPYYKLKSSLLPLAVEQQPMPIGTYLNVVLFADAASATARAMKDLGVNVLGQGPSPFGPVLTLQAPPASLVALAQLPGVQLIERAAPRVLANDLSRVTMGVASNTLPADTNYFGLTGSNVVVAQVDSGVDITHPDLTGRVITNSPAAGMDTEGHGTHVAGIILGSGAASATVTPAAPGSVLGADFRGKAPGAKLFSMVLQENLSVLGLDFDSYAQQQAAATNAFICNNSWGARGDAEYSILSASYDAATRDSLPGQTGSQPVLYVFAAGNDGGGNDDGLSGVAGSISAPGTGKNVITVGALEQFRSITNEAVIDGVTNTPWAGRTDSANEVATYSSRGNVGVGVEGTYGRFKPDVVAPGTFVISTRSAQWDESAYYSTTNRQERTKNDLVLGPNALYQDQVFVPFNAIGLQIIATPTGKSASTVSNLNIYVSQTDPPSGTNGLLGVNQVSIPPALPLTPGSGYFIAVGNPANKEITFDLTTIITSTNNLEDYNRVLRQLNNALGGSYRYESGTSMAAPAVSGMLALMQEYYEQRLQVTNSPALMKALLINGARSASSIYDLQVQTTVNLQGWGLANLPTSLPPASNSVALGTPASFVFFDQSPTNALATGESQTRTVTVANAGQSRPLRFTLVWTDPPGNPAAGIKLVNDLDLVVTNLDSGEVYFGNDIPLNSDFTSKWQTNAAPNIDVVNNVENVYIASPAGTNASSTNLNANFSVTVIGHRVNVNAVTAHTNNVVQDYALVISSGDGEVTDAFTVAESPLVSGPADNVSVSTNLNPIPLLNQTVGASTPLIAALNGITNQWHFYVITNYGTNAFFTNAAFLTFLPPTLSVPRGGVRATDKPEEISRPEGDIDMYVSQSAGLTNLDAVAVAGAFRSAGRGGTEVITFSNSAPGQVYYIGVKSEDQMAGQYGFIGLFSDQPFSSLDEEGNEYVRGLPVPAIIPDGTPSKPGAALVFGIAVTPIKVRRAIVTNIISHENFGDLLVNFSHNNSFAVLHNGSFGNGDYSQMFTYDDSEEGDIPGARKSDGPGSLRSFVGQEGIGMWLWTVVDGASPSTGRVESATLKIDKQDIEGEGDNLTIQPHGWAFTFVEVPVEATNLTVTVVNTSVQPLPVDVYIRRGDFPTFTEYDKWATAFPMTNSISISKADLPPLQAGIYYIGVFNPNNIIQKVNVKAKLDLDLNGVAPKIFASTNTLPLFDDAVMYDSIRVTNDQRVITAEVGVRLSHPRVSDLALTLVSPNGTRVLLFENRGGTDPNGLGATIVTTNLLLTAAGDTNAASLIVTNLAQSGTLLLDYQFIGTNSVSVYDGTNLVGSTLLINDATNQFALPYGPLSTNFVELRVNETNSTDTNSLWTLSVSSLTPSGFLFANFTENTNKVSDPTNLLKFATPPFSIPNYTGTNAAFSNQIFYLPEESLAALKGEEALGQWKLEIWDSRVGATNPAPELLQWNLSFIFEQVPITAIMLQPFVTITSTVPAGAIEYLIVDVPPWATAATNYLISADLPLFVWFNQNGAPTGTNPPDFALFGPAPVTNGVTTLVANSVPPPPVLLPGQRYYLGVQNTNAIAVTYSYRVDYDIISLTNAVPFLSTTTSNGIPRYFAYDVSTNASAVAFDLFGLDGNVDLVARQGTPLPTFFSYDYGSFNFGTNEEQILVFTNGAPVALQPGRWYLGVLNATTTAVNYTIQATEFTNPFPAIVTLTNAIPYVVSSNNAAPGTPQYYHYVVTSAAARVQFEIFGATGDYTLVASKGLPLPDLLNFDYRSANGGTNDEVIVILTNSVPISLTFGDWFITAVKISPGLADYSIMATEWPATARPVQVISSGVNGTDYCLTWASLPGVHYYVEGKTNLVDPAWITVTPTITAFANTTTWCIPLPTPYSYFRIVEGVVLGPAPPFPTVITGTTITATNVTLTWFGPLTSTYQVQWTDTLVPPNWQLVPGAITSTTGIFTFTDDGTLTGGTLTSPRFYRLNQLP